ncbi:hypothetical protein Y032_0028g1702 [Ancylostoma ceylanicum]|nr:hypothetical protein Y032_0028g1702 [Ancylostoma ceylanicum]
MQAVLELLTEHHENIELHGLSVAQALTKANPPKRWPIKDSTDNLVLAKKNIIHTDSQCRGSKTTGLGNWYEISLS